MQWLLGGICLTDEFLRKNNQDEPMNHPTTPDIVGIGVHTCCFSCCVVKHPHADCSELIQCECNCHKSRPHNTSPEKEVEITPLGKDLGAYAKDHPAKEPCYVDSVVEEFRDFWVSLFGTSFGGNSKKIEQFLRRVVSGANLEGFSRGAQQEFDRAKITNKEYYETGCTQRTQEIIEIAESLKKECLLCERIPGRVCHLYSHNYALDRLLEELKG